MQIEFEAKVCHISFSIGLFSKEHIIAWADGVIDRLEASAIPDRVFDLSLVKKDADIPGWLFELGTAYTQEEDEALLSVVGILHQSYMNKQNALHEICEYFYRLSNYVGFDHEWNGYLYALAGNLEIALDGYGDIDASREEIEHFLAEAKQYAALFDLQVIPNVPVISEFTPRKDCIVIDVSRVSVPLDLHIILKRQLALPDVYGMNWSAFWDAITGMVKLPRRIIITGWSDLLERFPKEAKNLQRIFTDYSLTYNNDNFTVDYL